MNHKYYNKPNKKQSEKQPSKEDISLAFRRSLGLTFKQSVTEYAAENYIFEDNKFSVRGREFQEEILNSYAEELTVMKPSQVGLTTISIAKALLFPKFYPNRNCVYAMPSDSIMAEIYDEKILPRVNANRHIFPKDSAQDKTSSSHIRIDGSSIFLKGVISKTASFSISGDYLILDEFDLMPMATATQMQSRLQASSLGLFHKFSTPTICDFGIDSSFQQSSQAEYLVTCDSCGHHQSPEFDPSWIKTGDDVTDRIFSNYGSFEEIPLDILINIPTEILLNGYAVCEKCGSRLDLDSTYKKRSWVHAYPERSHKGYKISPFNFYKFNPQSKLTSIGYMLTKFVTHMIDSNMDKFWQSVIGLPVLIGANGIGKELLESIKGLKHNRAIDNLADYKEFFLGFDVGTTCFGSLLGIRNDNTIEFLEIYAVKKEELTEHIETLFKFYGDKISGCIDLYPEMLKSYEIQKITNQRMKVVHFDSPRTPNKPVIDPIFEDEANTKLKYLCVNRTLVIDMMVKELKTHQIKINGYEKPGWNQVLKQVKDNRKITDENGRSKWICPHNNDHIFFGMIYAWTAFVLKHNYSSQTPSSIIAPAKSMISLGASPFKVRR